MTIKTVVDHVRGCGWRKPGGLYLVSGGLTLPCGKLPVPVDRCPCCDAGIKPARGWTWINPRPFFEKKPCCKCTVDFQCPLNVSNLPDRVGLLWVGEKFYPRPADFAGEAARLGVSRRVSQIPHDFKLGETWILFGHRKAATTQNPDKTAGQPAWIFSPGIFHAFKPTEIQYVVTGKETDDELAALVKRGITPIKIKRSEEQEALVL